MDSPKRRGKLKIYMGMAAGVGKTFAMLSDARVATARGVEIVAGYIEPHGRRDTERLAESFEQIPVRVLQHRGVELREFDLDGALARAPSVLLVDELAHSNVSPARHAKRWQDIEELLAYGISVHTTVNVQHIESLRDVVAKVTGVLVTETVPDAFISQANDIELIDIPPEELIQRLKDGKIYAAAKVDQALNHFFKKGNLIALRELALRHTAELVDAEMRHFRTTNAVKTLWPTTDRVLVCIGANHMAARLVRSARRLATSLHAELIAVSIESSRFARLSKNQRELATHALQLAETLGAKVVVSSAEDIVAEILRIAREHDVTLIVVGKQIKPRWFDLLHRSLPDDIVRRSGDIDVQVITGECPKESPIASTEPAALVSVRGSCAVLGVTIVSTAIGGVISPFVDLSNIIMLYLLGVAWTATKFGRWEAIAAAVMSVLAFDFFFVPPPLTFAVSDAQYLITFVVMLVIAILISSLTLHIRAQSQIVMNRERRTAALYELSKQLATSGSRDEIVRVSLDTLRRIINEAAIIYLPDARNDLVAFGSKPEQASGSPNELAVARWVFEHQTRAGVGTDTLPGSQGLYLPLMCTRGCIGVLGVIVTGKDIDISQRNLLEAFTGQIALALERTMVEHQSRLAAIDLEREQLRSSLLSSVSHDIRTPLAAIAGAASVMLENSHLDRDKQLDLTRTIADEADRLSRLSRNVLDMTRFDCGAVHLKRDWHSLEEIVGSALVRTEKLVGPRSVISTLPENLPLVFGDGLLLEQLFINLLENSARHTPLTTTINISAEVLESQFAITFTDNGPGLTAEDFDKIFDKLYRASKQSQDGFGLGLAICKAIANAHDGSITAHKQSPQGITFRLLLPRRFPEPEVPNE